jgi:O-antigen/teichoic acid export membrane protein
MLGALGRTREVGWYGAAYVFLLGVVLVIGALRNAYFPSLSRSLQGEGLARVRLLRQYGRLTAGLALPLAIAGPLAAGPLVRLLYGEEFAPAAAALRILLLTGSVMCFSSYFGSELLATGANRASLLAVASGAAVNLLLNVALIPPFSQNGAAVATLVAEATVCTILWWRTRGRGLSVLPHAASAAVPAVMGGATLVVALLLLPGYGALFAAGVAYLGAVVVWEQRRRPQGRASAT